MRNLGLKRSRLIDAQIPGVQDPLLMAFGVDGDQINADGLLAVGTRQENEIAAAAYVAETGRGWLEALEIVRFAFSEADGYLRRKAVYTPPFEGSQALLALLSSRGIKVGILSADSTANVEDFVQYYGLADYIQVQMGAERGMAKPNPACLRQACDYLNVSPEVTLVVGDSQADLLMARNANAAGFVAVAWGRPQTVPLANADVLIDRFDEIQLVS
ncbi:MAG: HAD family hydrolase [Pseudanabaenales cyanobacterium]|nr:HAD family hydrolase [Pseudanabaenales cyanobacterium]